MSSGTISPGTNGNGLQPVTPISITKAGALRAALHVIRRVGYAVDQGEHIQELRCVAAPIIDRHGQAIAAISISGLQSRVPETRLDDLGRKVRDAASALTVAIGGHSVGSGFDLTSA